MTIDSSTTSASATTIICTPVGTPIFSTAFSSCGWMRRQRTNSASGASGLFFWRSRKPSHVVATANESTEAHAPAATPNCGNPPQPRMSAGVTTRPMAVEIKSVSSGVMVSPTPRSMAVASRNRNTPGIAISMMRA
ncbi:hypothetical protein D9M72_169210 [compost metagenome]